MIYYILGAILALGLLTGLTIWDRRLAKTKPEDPS